MTWLFGVRRIAETLNQYANLLLVIVTITYVFLTWRTLKSLQRASRRERELRHLEDIKHYVARPLISWLDIEGLAKLSGGNPLIQVKTVAVPKLKPTLGETPYEYPRSLEHTLNVPRDISHVLLSHVSESHFVEQMAAFESFSSTLWKLASDCAVFAKDCANKLAGSTNTRRDLATDSLPEVADSDALVEVCIRDIMLGRPTAQIGMYSPSANNLEVRDGFSSRLLGRSSGESIQKWAESGVALVQERWAISGFPERIKQLLDRATTVREILEKIEFTYDLPGECNYVESLRHHSSPRI